ncbi:AEG_G0016840.mRNA.1.CDS.1 [Saccharomyces cerevisiae]|nr:AEG_G0016840.mRNA.1.CDS.1 [Saccharomyces cerevisiae]CAI6642464.1 AEG_G0016840.mRNA.1.CDS.1 [Saccharomyces cerevisiae]
MFHSWKTLSTDPGTFHKVLVFTLKSSSVPMTPMLDTSSTMLSFSIETCSTGPGFSCEINEFYGYAEKRVAGTEFLKVCNVSSVSNSTELTFFWDWNTKHYNDIY